MTSKGYFQGLAGLTTAIVYAGPPALWRADPAAAPRIPTRRDT